MHELAVLPSTPRPPGSGRHPSWIKVRAPGGRRYEKLKEILGARGLHTVCEEAECPNIGECWGHGTATFMLLGDLCTRGCRFCAVGKGKPEPPDPAEPEHIAEAVEALGLDYAVLTSVDRDDLPDQGAGHFARTIEAIRRRLPGCGVEALVPDFQGDPACVGRVAATPLTVFAHNIETVPRLYRHVRPGAVYERSLNVLELAKYRSPDPALLTKASLILGLGEERSELEDVFADLRDHGCDILTLGQYLRPSHHQLPVVRYLPPEEFAELRAGALAHGFRQVVSGPLVRSSYHAWEAVMAK